MNNKNWLVCFLAGMLVLTSFQSCKKNENDQKVNDDTGPTEWTRVAVFPDAPRNGAASFVLGGEGYVIGGFNPANNTIFNDVYSFDGRQWKTRGKFEAGPARFNAVGFSIDGVGYYGTGYGNVMNKEGISELGALNDFYSINPAATEQTWKKVADFPGEARFGAIAFSLGKYGYVGLGTNSNQKTFSDLYRFDPSSDTPWTRLEVPFSWKKAYSFVFVIGDKAYLGGGVSNNQLPDDFYEFDGQNWKELHSLVRNDADNKYDVRRYSAGAFAIGNKGYIVSGRNTADVINNVWTYDPASDKWTGQHQALLGSGRERSVSFELNGKGYIVTGSRASLFFDDNWEFTPKR